MQFFSFLTEREGRYKPGEKELKKLQRLEKIDFTGTIHLSSKPTKTDMIIVYPGDLVISGINVAKGAIAIWDGDDPITATIHYSSYTFDKEIINIDFFKRFLKSPLFIRTLQEQVKSGIKTEIKAKNFLPLQVNIPSLPEQQKINRHFESFENDLSELDQELISQSSFITKLRQTILQEAIEGKLTADWRNSNPVRKGDPEYDGAALLAKIKVEKQKMIDEGKIRKEKPLAPIKPEDEPFALPDGWVWARLGEIIENIKYGTSKNCDYNSNKNSKVLRIPNVSSGYIDDTDLKYCNLDKSEKHNGYAYAGYLIRLRFNKPLICSNYLWFVTKANYFRELIERPLRTTVGINNINSNELSVLLIPLPPLAEQQVIVERVEKLLAMVDNLETQARERKEQAEGLVKAVLREAFETTKQSSSVGVVSTSSKQNIQDKQFTSFQQMQIVAAIIDGIHRVHQHQGEMIIAKYLYILKFAYKIETGFNFQKWHFGPYDPKLKKIINNRTYFTRSGKDEFQTIGIKNTDKLFKYHNRQVNEIRKHIAEMLDIFKKYNNVGERDHKIELLACVLKIIEELKKSDLDSVYAGFKEWETDKEITGFSNKAEKFNEEEVGKCLEFAKKKEWIQ